MPLSQQAVLIMPKRHFQAQAEDVVAPSSGRRRSSRGEGASNIIEGNPMQSRFFKHLSTSFRGETQTRGPSLSGAVGAELGSEALRSGTKRIISQMGVALGRARARVPQQAPDDLKAEAA